MFQCLLEKGNRKQFAWIDVNRNDLNKWVDLKTKDGFSKNWLISKIYGPNISKKIINDRSQDYKNMKKMTDI